MSKTPPLIWYNALMGINTIKTRIIRKIIHTRTFVNILAIVIRKK